MKKEFFIFIAVILVVSLISVMSFNKVMTGKIVYGARCTDSDSGKDQYNYGFTKLMQITTIKSEGD